MGKKINLLNLIFIFIFVNQLFSQNISETRKYINGKEFYIHKVKRGETVYGIAYTYHIEMKDIIIWNPKLSQGIKRGQKLRIPVISGLNKEADEISRAGEFIYHVVEKQQSLFNISQIYNVNIDLLTRFNPEVKLGIKRGEVIRIPRDSTIFAKGAEKFIFHKVSKHETLFFIAQKYGIEINELYRLNPFLKSEGLKAGATVKIPKLNLLENQNLKITDRQKVNPFSDSLFFIDKNSYHCDTFYYDKITDTLHIALLLPIYLKQNLQDSVTYKINYFKNSKRFYDIYQGMLLALDNLKKQVNVKLYLFDTENNVSKVIRILENPEFKRMDLILGPVYSKNVAIVADYAKQHNINMVSLLSKNNSLLKNNPHIFQANPSDGMRIEKSAYYLSNFYDSSIVAIHTGTLKELNLIDLYKKKLIEAFSLSNALDEIVFKEVNYKARGQQAIEDALSLGLKNIVIIPSTNEADVMEMLTKLEYLANFYDITVYGMPEWETFDNVELDLFTRLKTHYPSSSFVDYNNYKVKEFIRNYRNNFSVEPGIYSYLGYDVVHFFVQILKNHGRNFQNCLKEPDVKTYQKGLLINFDFEAKTFYDGFENNSIFIIEYMPDYTLKVKAGDLKQGYFMNRFAN